MKKEQPPIVEEEPKREIPKISGVVEEYIAGITKLDKKPFNQIKLKNDHRDYTFYGGGWTKIEPGTSVELFSEQGFDMKSQDDGEANFYLEGIKVYDKDGNLILTSKKHYDTSI